jgi:hypothetical protein
VAAFAVEVPVVIDPGDTPALERPDGAERLVAVEAPQGAGRAARLFATGVLGGALSLFGLGSITVPATCHCHCGATVADQEAAARRRRCMELGVTPEELDALDRARTVPSGPED